MSETSVIIRTFNESKHLPRLFAALRSQTYTDFEIIVVDSGSLDNTREIAAAEADHVIRIRQDDFTFGYSLNTGIARACGRYVVMISAHAAPVDGGWLERLIEPLRSEKTAMVYGRQIGDSESKLGEFVDFLRTFGVERRVLQAPCFFANNANSAIRRDLWSQHRFDEALSGLEDIEWAKHFMEAGYHVVYQPDACIYHSHAESWPQLRRRYHREALAAKWIGLRGRSSLVTDAWHEMRSLAGDIRWAFRERRLAGRLGEILRFRYEKLFGTVAGTLDESSLADPSKRHHLLFNDQYNAVVISGPGRAELREVEMPDLKPGDVLIRVECEGVCATDIEVFRGTLGYYKSGLAKYPIVPGHESAGRIVAVGSRVHDIRVGTPVVVECIQGCGHCSACQSGFEIGCAERTEVGVIGRDGGYAEFMVTPRRFVHVVPDDVPLTKACLCEPLAVVLKALRRLESTVAASPNASQVGVVGAGSIGHLAARVLALRGRQVTVFDRDPGRLKYFEGSNICTETDLSRLDRFQVLVEATGDPDALTTLVQDSAAGATLLLLGLPYARREFSFETIVGYDKTVVGSVGSSGRDFDEAIRLLPSLDLSWFFKSLYPLEDFMNAWAAASGRTALKTILRTRSSSDAEAPTDESAIT
jgi:2-desacetyl-2-hydroxyethyl bacteriochlorophyllide A dehydrogenase